MNIKDERLDRLTRVPKASNAELGNYEWLAFQYLSDELTSQQRTDFEETLSSDPAAAEALQAMVAVTLQVQAATKSSAGAAAMSSKVAVSSTERFGESGVRQTAGRRNSLLWLAGLAAGLLLLVGAIQFFVPRGSASKPTVTAETPTESEMAEVWSGSFEDEFAIDLARIDENSSFDASESKTPVATSIDAQTESQTLEEDWLYSALVSLESAEDWPSEGQGGS
jgi:hypothetical protein